MAGTTTIPDLNHGDFYSTPFLFLKLEEQKNIVVFLNQKTREIDKTIFKIDDSINLLKEYRSSLITHAVSGQIDITKYEVSK